MKIVIEIPDEYKKQFDENRCKENFDSLATNEFGYILRKAFENGTPLPKGHGDLIDRKDLREDFKTSKKISFAERMDIACIVDHAHAIIEADTEGS